MPYISKSAIILLSVLAVCSGSRYEGQNQNELKTIIASIFEGRENFIPTRYSSFYAPPKSAKPSATRVQMRFKDVKIRVTDSSERPSVGCVGLFEMVYNDSRLRYENVEGYTQKFINLDSVSSYSPIEIWSPDIFREQSMLGDEPFISGQNPYYRRLQLRVETSKKITLFNAEGMVFNQRKLAVVTHLVGLDAKNDKKGYTASFKFMDKRFFKEDVILEWEPIDPFTLQSDGLINSSSNATYQVTHAFQKCHSGVNYGPFGHHEHSCTELRLQFTPK